MIRWKFQRYQYVFDLWAFQSELIYEDKGEGAMKSWPIKISKEKTQLLLNVYSQNRISVVLLSHSCLEYIFLFCFQQFVHWLWFDKMWRHTTIVQATTIRFNTKRHAYLSSLYLLILNCDKKTRKKNEIIAAINAMWNCTHCYWWNAFSEHICDLLAASLLVLVSHLLVHRIFPDFIFHIDDYCKSILLRKTCPSYNLFIVFPSRQNYTPWPSYFYEASAVSWFCISLVPFMFEFHACT